MIRRHSSSGAVAWAALATSVIALVVAASGSAGAAKHVRKTSRAPRGPGR